MSNIKDVQAYIKSKKADFGITGNVTPTAVKNFLNSPNTADDVINSLSLHFDYVEKAVPETTSAPINLDGVDQAVFTRVNDKGVEISAPIINGTFVKYKNRACQFDIGNGTLVLNYQDTLANLYLNGGLVKGDVVPFNPDTFEQFKNYAIMNINGTAFEKADKLYAYQDQVKQAIDKDTRALRMRGASQAQIDERIASKYFDGALDETPVPSMPKFS